MQGVEVQPHIQISKTSLQPVVLVCRDAEYASLIAKKCQPSVQIADNREYRSFECTLANGSLFSVVSHGIGFGGAIICFEELIACGAKFIIRIDTCLSLRPKVFKDGDIINVVAAARQRTTDLYMPPGVPCVADMHVFQTITKSIAETKIHVREAIVLSTDVFYGFDEESQTKEMAGWAKHVEVVDMETASLYMCCSGREVGAGCLLVVKGTALKSEEYVPSSEASEKSVEACLQVAVLACTKLREEISN